MSKIKLVRFLSFLAVVGMSSFAEGAQADTWTTAIKITCDNSVAEASATKLKLCTTTNCNTYSTPPDVVCGGTETRNRSAGYRFETDFKPGLINYTLEVKDQSGRVICFEEVNGTPVGSTATCQDGKSPKLSVGRPH
jgi:hypothetical protein